MHVYSVKTEFCTENLENQNKKCPSELEPFDTYRMTRRDSEYNLNLVLGEGVSGVFALLFSMGEDNNSLCL